MLFLDSPPPPGPRSKAHANAVGSEPVQSRTQGPSGTHRPGLWLGDSPASWWSYSSLLCSVLSPATQVVATPVSPARGTTLPSSSH